MSTANEAFETLLKENGFSLTRQRTALFSLLTGQEPLSMHEVVVKAAGTMDRASVYRTIELFEKIGVVRRINIGWKYKLELSDTFVEHHHHLTCLNCKRVIPINEQAFESFIDKLATEYQFMPIEHQIEVQGYCDQCHK